MQFNQPDTLIPDPYNVLDWNRYAYARFNPLRYTDPTGHVSTDECGPDGIYCENKRFSQSSIAKIFKSEKDKKAAARTIATFIEDPGYFLDLYMDPGNAWGKRDEVAYLDAYAQYSLGMSAEDLLLATYGYLDAFELRAARTQYLLGNAEIGDAILTAATVGGIYTLRNPMTGDVVRVGRTKDFLRRQKEYYRDVNTFDLQFSKEYTTSDYATQRGLEQMLYEKYGAPPLNINRPIRIGNPNSLSYLRAAWKFLYGPK